MPSPQDRALFQVFYGFALFPEFVGIDPLGRARYARIFLAGIRHFDFKECALTASCNSTALEILLCGPA